jgi:hypothetical protein
MMLATRVIALRVALLKSWLASQRFFYGKGGVLNRVQCCSFAVDQINNENSLRKFHVPFDNVMLITVL